MLILQQQFAASPPPHRPRLRPSPPFSSLENAARQCTISYGLCHLPSPAQEASRESRLRFRIETKLTVFFEYRCDEIFDNNAHTGVCERCFKSRVTCDRSPMPRSHGKPRTRVAASAPVDPQASGSGETSHSDSSRLPSAPSPDALATSAARTNPVAPLDFDSLFREFSETLGAIPFSSQPSMRPLLASDMLDSVLNPSGGVSGLTASRDAAGSNNGTATAGACDFPFNNGLLAKYSQSTFADVGPQQLNSSYFASFPEPVRSCIASTITTSSTHCDLNQTASDAVVLLHQAKAVTQEPHHRELLLAESHARFEDALRHLVSPGIPLATRLIVGWSLS